MKAIVGACLALAAAVSPATAQSQGAPAVVDRRPSLDDTWWTGPMLANSAATLPRGHVLLEPYVYDVATAAGNGFGSRSYLLYGATNRLTVGLIPVLGFAAPHDGPNSSRIGFGDLTALAEYALTTFHQDRRLPAMAVMVQETLPTGRYDRLGDRPSDGFGAGAYTTTIQFNAQTYVWLPTGRVLRMRLNLSDGMSRRATVNGASVYGTPEGFRGTASQGNILFADVSGEYGLVRRVALATDLFYSRNGIARVAGVDIFSPVAPSLFERQSAASRAFGIAPAVELSLSRSLGVLLGVRVIPGAAGSLLSVTPALAINFVH